MIQTGLIQNAHGDLVTDASYDFYGLRLATCSLDQRIKIWQLDENNTWNVEDDWKAHDAAVSKLSWAHPEFGSIIASSSFDRTVKIWEQTSTSQGDSQVNGAQHGPGGFNSRWVERAVLSDAKGTVRAVEFAPHHFGLKLATISTDNLLRVYECSEQPSLNTWTLNDELDIQNMALGPSPGHVSRAHTMALATPTQTNATLEGANASLVTAALLQQTTTNAPAPGRPGNREADGGWCISWCKDKYWGEVIAAGCGTTGVIKIIQLNSRRSTTLLALPSASNTASNSANSAANSNSATSADNTEARSSSTSTNTNNSSSAITSVSWAPSCGRSYHLIATGGRDGHVRIWKVKPGSEDADIENAGDSDGEDAKWTAVAVADFEQHKSAVGRVEWNITGTILSSAGNDGRVRLWKATSGSVWRPAGSVCVEQSEEPSQPESKDVEMDS